MSYTGFPKLGEEYLDGMKLSTRAGFSLTSPIFDEISVI